MTTAVVIILVALLLFAALRLWITANRLDRLHVRTEAAWSALEGALARRIVATRAVAAAGGLDGEQADRLRGLADIADRADRRHRADAENDLSRALSMMPAVPEPHLALELADARERVVLARRFYNDAVRDTRALRGVWFTRVFGLAGRAALPDYFEIAEFPHTPATVHRTAARVVVVDPDDRILLLSGTDPDVASHWWHTPGGGVEDGEDIRATATRELAEETGFRVPESELLGPIWRRVARFTFMGSQYEQTELYFVTRLPQPAGGAFAGAAADGAVADGAVADGAAADGAVAVGAAADGAGGTPREVAGSRGGSVNGSAVRNPGEHQRAGSATRVLLASPRGERFAVDAEPDPGHADGAEGNGADPGRLVSVGEALIGADVRVDAVSADPAGPRINGSGRTEVERLTLTGHRWWSAEALQHTDEAVYPVQLARRLREALDVVHGAAVPESYTAID